MSKLALEHVATIDKYIGDAIMLFFGNPESQGVEKDAIASLKTAIAMQKKMYELNVLWQKRGIEKPLELRIGINTGYCTVGNFGSEDRMNYTIIGSEVNLAERLESLADPGGILVGHETSCLVSSHIQLDEQTPKQVKGFANPVRNYKVIGWRDNSTEPFTEAEFHLGGVSLVLNPKEMSKQEQQQYVDTLNEIMAFLKAES